MFNKNSENYVGLDVKSQNKSRVRKRRRRRYSNWGEPSFESIHCKLSYKFFELFGYDNNEEYEIFEGFDIEDV